MKEFLYALYGLVVYLSLFGCLFLAFFLLNYAQDQSFKRERELYKKNRDQDKED